MTDQEMRAAFFKLTQLPSANHSDKFKLFCAAIKFEREECAAICDRFADREMHPAECAGAIRMRSNV